ncbi:MAG: DUF72 domain-containing protein [Pseudomonadota bacterium]
MSRLPYRLGLPAWAFPGWRGRYFPADRPMLTSYAQVFNTVEGNTSFYRTPSEQAVDGWRDALSASDLEICFKLPRAVTHERYTDPAVLHEFLEAIEPLEGHLGPLLVQFPATIGEAELPAVEGLLEALPRARRAVIEVRHPQLFSKPTLLEPLLDRFELGRVVLDARPIFEGDRSHPDVLRALHAKPDLPVRPAVYHGLSFVRLVLHPDLESNAAYLSEWAERSAESIDAGHATYMMIHCPNNLHCPTLAAQFHELLRDRVSGMDNLAAWPVPQQGQLL